ncbi:hypothetical protein M0G74_07995 [Microbulbifer sp. CAU 1566]|uniref:hypothetical protein n=1 Tax=Microbulbifer sp. CAU 1566 TaxID=2933269 RepID=UPI0020030F6A|nr:hypothetical protein [Microbulbifer sp. CAU 1566]MCK7597214.1 hypothetical protein [Microbulbifer sp. CAU 1566]
MYIVTLDWAEILKNLLPVFTLIIGSVTTYLIQRQKRNREDTTRFHVHRLEKYSDFMHSAIKSSMAMHQGTIDFAAFDKVGHGIAIITLIGNPTTKERASAFAKVYSKIFNLVQSGSEIPTNLTTEYSETMANLSTSLRTELQQ